MLDIILFAAFALYIGIKLYKALGDTKYDHDFYKDKTNQEPNPFEDEKVIDVPYQEVEEDDYAALSTKHGAENSDKIKQLHKLDPTFTEKSFVEGAKYAFEIILEAISFNNKDALKGLLSDKLYKSFATAIDKRQKSKNKEHITLIAVFDPVINNISIKGTYVEITAQMLSEQVIVTKDENGKVIEGDESEVEEIGELWTFARDFKSTDPNWEVVKTRAV